MSNNIDKMIENLNKGCYVGDVDYVPELSEDLKQTTIEKE